jgi:hypothetical protein
MMLVVMEFQRLLRHEGLERIVSVRKRRKGERHRVLLKDRGLGFDNRTRVRSN